MSEIVFLIRIMKCEKFSKCKKLFEKFSQIDYTNRIEKQTKKIFKQWSLMKSRSKKMKWKNHRITKLRKHENFDKIKTNKLNQQNTLYDDCHNAINDAKWKLIVTIILSYVENKNVKKNEL